MTTTDERTEAESVVAAVLMEHALISWDAGSWICNCPQMPQSVTLTEAVAHQATAVMFALNAWVAA